jgi:nicotinamidase-related amidase
MRIRATTLLLLAGCSTPAGESTSPLVLQARKRSEAGPSDETLRWDARKTAVVVVDMWDDHWCKGAAKRVVELAKAMDPVLRSARERGMFILHAPSSTVAFYKDTPARKRAQAAPFAKAPAPITSDTRWGTGWCWPDKPREPDLPIDDSDMGCDCATPCKIREAWTRQIDLLHVDPARDAITDDGQETWNLLKERGIANVIVMGVHLNMCVLGRPTAIRQLVRHGLNVVLVRDLTDSMYNHLKKPQVVHHAGTELVVEHVERYWCPSILSTSLTGRPPFRFSDDTRTWSMWTR